MGQRITRAVFLEAGTRTARKPVRPHMISTCDVLSAMKESKRTEAEGDGPGRPIAEEEVNPEDTGGSVASGPSGIGGGSHAAASRRIGGEFEKKGLSQREADDEEREEEPEEGRAAEKLTGPVRVSRAEREQHEFAHAPHRDRCDFCVQG